MRPLCTALERFPWGAHPILQDGGFWGSGWDQRSVSMVACTRYTVLIVEQSDKLPSCRRAARPDGESALARRS